MEAENERLQEEVLKVNVDVSRDDRNRSYTSSQVGTNVSDDDDEYGDDPHQVNCNDDRDANGAAAAVSYIYIQSYTCATGFIATTTR